MADSFGRRGRGRGRGVGVLRLAVAVVGAVSLMFTTVASPVLADDATFTWTGDEGVYWVDSGNWSPAGPPTAGSVALTGGVTYLDVPTPQLSGVTALGGGWLKLIDGGVLNTDVLTIGHDGYVSLEGTGGISDAAQVILQGTGALDISSRSGSETIGSLSGDPEAKVHLGDNTLISGSNDLDTEYAGSIWNLYSADSVGAGGLEKKGTGTLVLSGANSYAGLTTVSAGVLRIENNTALGATTGATTVTGGAALEVQGGLTGVAEAITLNGSGISDAGALRNVSGSNKLSGDITLESDARINAAGGTLTLEGAAIDDAGKNLTLGGAGYIDIYKSINTGAGTLTKDGIGLTSLFGLNAYTGETTVSAGMLAVFRAGALGNGAAGTTVSSGASLALGFNGTEGEAITLNGAGVDGIGALWGAANTTLTGDITLASDSRIASNQGTLALEGAAIDDAGKNLTLGGAGTIRVFKSINTDAGTLTKDGIGSVFLYADNDYTGQTTVSAGVLGAYGVGALGDGAAGTTVASGASLAFGFGGTEGEAITLNGAGVDGIGALVGVADTTLTGDITLASDSRIASIQGTLTLTGAAIDDAGKNLTLGGDGNVAVSKAIQTGSGTLTKDGAGTVTLSGVNTYTGQTTVSAGVLRIANNTALGTTDGATTVTGGAALEVQGDLTDVAEAITLNGFGIGNGGALRNVSGSNTLSSDITFGSDARINADSGSTLTLSGTAIDDAGKNLTLGGAGNVAVSKAIQTGSGTLTKDGAGTVTLSGVNTYTGQTTVSSGVLRIANNAALGTTDGATTVAGGAALELSNTGSVAETIILNGSGINNGGALRNVAGNNTLTGEIKLVPRTSVRINSDADTLYLDGGVAGDGSTVLTLAGNGDIVVNSNIQESALIKRNSGMVTLKVANDYTGTTEVMGGVLRIENAQALGGLGQGTTVSSGAALELSSAGTMDVAENITLNGGELRNVLGANTLSGNLTLAGNARINADSGSTLTLSGGAAIDDAGKNLTLGGDGNVAVSKAIQTGSGTLTKDGAGDVFLSGNNTYTGQTFVEEGTLVIGSDTALGSTDAGTFVDFDAALAVDGDGLSVGENITFGVGSGLWNAGGNELSGKIMLRSVPEEFAEDCGDCVAFFVQNFGGDLTLSGSIEDDPANPTGGFVPVVSLSSSSPGPDRDDDDDPYGTINVSGDIKTSALAIRVDGRVILSGDNTYTGMTVVAPYSALKIQSSSALGSAVHDENDFTWGDDFTAVFGGTLALEKTTADIVSAEDLLLAGTGFEGSDALLNLSGQNTLSGEIRIVGGYGFVFVRINADAGTLTLEGNIRDGDFPQPDSAAPEALAEQDPRQPSGLVLGGDGDIMISGNIDATLFELAKIGTGTVTLSGNNSYTSGTYVESGVLNIQSSTALGSADAGTYVNSGAALELAAAGSKLTVAEHIALNGYGMAPGALNETAATLRNMAGSNELSGEILAGGDARIEAAAGSSLTVSGLVKELVLDVTSLAGPMNGVNSLMLGGAGDITVSGDIETGAGEVVKNGAGTVTLSGTNTYTGATYVESGVLNIQSSTALGTDDGDTYVAENGVLELQSTGTSGLTVGEYIVLTGAGVSSGGALRNISGNNTVTEYVTLASDARINSDAGVLTLREGVGSKPGPYALTLGGAGGMVVEGEINSPTILIKDGTGTVTLSGASVYTGATNINDGTLDVTGSVASTAVNVGDGSGTAGSATLKVDGASLADTAAVTVKSDGALSGAGTEQIGTLTLDGGTLAAGAALSASGAKTLNGGMIAGTLSGAGTTTVQNGATTVSGSIVGDVTVASGGTLVLASNDAVTGKITTTGSVVEYLAGVTRTGEIALNSNTTQLKVASGTATQAGLISQDASSRPLEKTGAGTLILSGNNTYTGVTTVSEGKLIVNGSLAGATTVAAGAMIGGSGTIHSLTVGPGGMLSPGNSIGTVTMGSLTLHATSTTAIEVDSVTLTADKIAVTGAASLAGTLNVGRLAGTTAEAENTYTIITAGSITGTFGTVASNFLLLTPGVTYTSTSVVLTLTRSTTDDTNEIADFADTRNQIAVATAIDSTYAGLSQGSAAYQTLINQLVLATDAKELRNNLDQLSGAEYAQHLQSVLWSTRAINRIVTERMECGSSSQDYVKADGSMASFPAKDAPISATGCFTPGEAALWMRGFGSWNSLDGDDNAPGLDETQYGILFGADYSFDGDWFVGLSGGYFNSAGSFDSWGGRSGGSADYDGMQLAAYGGFDNSVFYLRGIAAYGNYDGDGSRGISGPGNIAGRLTGDPSSDVMSFYGETGYRIAAGGIGNVTPFAGLALAGATLDGFTEKDEGGTGAALRFDGEDASSTVSMLGLRLDSLIGTASGMFSPELSLAWAHEFGDTYQTLDASFADGPPGTDFTVTGSDVARDSLVVGADLNVALSDGLDLRLSYDGWFNGDYTSNAVTAKLGWNF